MAGNGEQPIIIKKIKKGGHGHHGGSWKVAYADFVTAMMAFFLLMWLLANTDEAEKVAIAGYFENPLAPAGVAGGTRVVPNKNLMSPEDILEQEAARFDSLAQAFEKLVAEDSTLHEFQDQLRLEITSEGLRIMILDEQDRAMFETGSASVKPHMREILQRIAQFVNNAPNPISLTGHTDAVQYFGGVTGYSNWELSADRANAARRALVAGGIRDDKIMRVEGVGSLKPLLPDNPTDPTNRRITIVLLNQATVDAIQGIQRPAPLPELAPTEPSN
jgi:chemotaxis protein MotB